MTILIAEDEIVSRTALERTLAEMNHETCCVENGLEAWKILQQNMVDIAILDWMMPGFTGPQLCKKIRTELKESDRYTYIILLTGRDGHEDAIEGLQAGADDYITKPFEKNMLKTRIQVGKRLVEYESLLLEKNRQLRKYNDEMLQLVEERSQQLVHAERMATIGLLAAGIAHEINNPTTFISGNTQTLRKLWDSIAPLLKDAHQKEPHENIPMILEDIPRMLEGISNGVRRISAIVKGLKGFCRKDDDQPHQQVSINDCVENALQLCNNELKYNIIVEKNLNSSLPNVIGNPQQIEQVLVNLLINAAHAIESSGEGRIEIKTYFDADSVMLSVADSGPGISPEKIHDIWQPFYTTKETGKGTGLGLYTVMGIVEKHMGNISVENRPGGGAVFTVVLPKAKENTNETQTTDC